MEQAMPAKDAPSQDHSMEGHAPPGTSIPFECSNGRLRLSVSPHPTGQSSGGIELIDVDLASIVDVFITASDDCRHVCVRNTAAHSSDASEKGISAKAQLKSLCVALLDRQGHLICSLQLEDSVANLNMINSECVADLSIGSVCCYDRHRGLVLSMHRAADAAPLALSLSAHMFPNFLVVRSGRFFLADSAVDMTRALCAPALAAANWYLQSLPLDPFASYSADARPFSVFFCDFSIAIGEVTASVCASENLDKLLGSLIRRNMIPSVLGNRAVLRLVKFFLKNGMSGIKVAPSPYTARQKLLQPDVAAAIQEDVVQQLQQLSSVLSVAGSALASVGRSLNL